VADHSVSDTGSRSQWAAIAAVFALVIGFTYSDDFIEFFADASGRKLPDVRWAILTLDLALIAGTAFLKWSVTGRTREAGAFLRKLLRGWWTVGAGLVLAIHLLLLSTPGPPRGWAVANSPWLTLLTNAAFVSAMGLMLASALTGDGAKGWILPVLIGTFVAQFASALWYPVIDSGSGCADNISSDYFNGMIQVLPVFLVTLGLEVNYLRTTKAFRDPGRRAVSVLTVLLLCTAEALAFSMLVTDGRVRCGTAASWHEYVAFVITVHAAAISLATLAWLLLGSQRARS
jgi:hypothetical protein